MTPGSHHTSADDGTQSDLRDELKADGARLRSSAGERARQEAELRKGQAAQVAGSASSALGSAAQDLADNPDAPDWMASALRQAARRIESLGKAVEGRNVDQLSGDVTRFARENPMTFLAASAAAGFAASRVLRAGVDRKRHDAEDSHADHGGQGSRDGSSDAPATQEWPADENAMPTGAQGRDFAPAYGVPASEDAGGTR
jgi:hypothetical protein